MEYFYENIAVGMPKNVALSQAKLTYLSQVNGIATHPAFWSPFIQLGNNSPITLQKKTNWWLGGSLAVLTGILCTGLVLRKKRA